MFFISILNATCRTLQVDKSCVYITNKHWNNKKVLILKETHKVERERFFDFGKPLILAALLERNEREQHFAFRKKTYCSQ